MKRIIFYGFASLMLTGCTVQNHGAMNSQPSIKREQGHITLCAGGSRFETAHTWYNIFNEDAPEWLWSELKKQKRHKDISSITNQGRSLYVDVEGFIYYIDKRLTEKPCFHIDKVYDYGMPKKEYIETVAARTK